VGRDFFNTSKYTYQTDFIYQDYAGVGVNLYGYTQQFGNGIAATVSVQDPWLCWSRWKSLRARWRTDQ